MKKLAIWTGISVVLLITTIIFGSKAMVKQKEWKATEAYIAGQSSSLSKILEEGELNGSYDLSRDLNKEIVVSEEENEEVEALLHEFLYSFMTYESLDAPYDKDIATESFQKILVRNPNVKSQKVQSEKHYLIHYEDKLLIELITAMEETYLGAEADVLRRFTFEVTKENEVFKINNFTTSELEPLYWEEDPWTNP